MKLIKKLSPAIIAFCALVFSLWLEHQISFFGLNQIPIGIFLIWGLILIAAAVLSLIIASKTKNSRTGILKFLHIPFIICSLIIGIFGSTIRLALQPSELYSADIYMWGLSNFRSMSLMDNNSYILYQSGCFHHSQISGNYRIHEDTLFIENFSELSSFLGHDITRLDSKLEFTSSDSTSHNMLSLTVSN